MSGSAAERIASVFSGVGARGWLHARPVDASHGALEVALDADAPVSAASVIKIVFAVAFARAVCTGTLDPHERVEVPARLRIGGSGTAGFADPPVVSLRDLALSMMSVSDNAATDIVLDRVGRPTIEAVIGDLGLTGTRFVRTMLEGAEQAVAELRFPDLLDIDARLAAADPAAVRALAWLDPARSNALTPRDTTRLLCAIWNDEAAPAEGCAMVRAMMAQQQNTQRLASGFGGEVAVADKTGTLPTVRNDAGVVTFPDGAAYAVAVFTRDGVLAERNAPLDAAIGTAGAIAVEQLRAYVRAADIR